MRKTFVLLALVAVFGAFSMPAKKVKFQYDAKVGDQFVLYQETEQVIEQSVMGMDQKITNSIKGEFLLDVKEVDAAFILFDVWFSRVYFKMDNPMAPMLMDSESKDTSDLMTKLGLALTKKPMGMKLGRNGKILELIGGDELTEDVMGTFEGLSAMQAAQIRAFLQQAYAEDQLKSNLSDFLVEYPSEAFDQKESWTTKSTVPALDLLVEHTWKLEPGANSKDQRVAISGEGKILSKDTEKIVDLPNGMQATYKFVGEKTATGIIDQKTGMIRSLDISSTVDGNMKLLQNAQIPEDLEIPMTLKTSTSYRLEKK